MCFAYFTSASGDGFGLRMSNVVVTYWKYFAKPKVSSSLMIFPFGTCRIVISASFAFFESFCIVPLMLGIGFAFVVVA